MAASNRRDVVFVWVLRSISSVAAGIVILVALFVAREALSALYGDDGTTIHLSQVVADDSWQPSANQFNLTPMVVGSLLATLGALLLTGPLGIGGAVFLNFYSVGWMSWLLRRTVEIMAGVPSVVYGLWGLSVLVPLIARWSPIGQGQSLLAGVLILTFMTLPTVVITADAAIRTVPKSQLAAAMALGLGRRAIVWSIVLPAASRGLFSAVILQVARAIGETMAVLMVCGNVVQTPDSIFAPVRTLTANIALEMGYADERHRSVLFLSGLLGLVLVAILMVVANVIAKQNRQSP